MPHEDGKLLELYLAAKAGDPDLFAEAELCSICSADDRDRSVIAVVEEPFDVVALEKTSRYRGLYHVLGGVLSPLDGISADKLEIASLIKRVQEGGPCAHQVPAES